MRMYQECKVGQRGPPSNVINEGLILPALKSKVGPSDVSCILGCMNIKPPSQALIYKKFNSLCDKMMQINEQAMIQNQHFVKAFCEASVLDQGVMVETDSSFNN